MGTPNQEKAGELRINLRLKKPEQDALERLLKHCWPQARSRARAIRTAIADYPRAMDALTAKQERVEQLEAVLSGLLAAEDTMNSAQELKQAGLEKVRAALNGGGGGK